MGAVIIDRRGEADVGIVGEDGVAVLVHGVVIGLVEFVFPGERGAGIFATPDGLLLEINVGAVPVFQGHADSAHDDVRTAFHPFGAFIADPDMIVHELAIGGGRVVGAVLEAHEIAGGATGSVGGKEAGLGPAQLGDIV